MGHHLLRRITNLTLAFLLAVFSINLSGVLSLQNAYADDDHGNNETLKVHEKGTPSGTESNDPKVCKFNFEGFNFDKNQSGYIKVATQPGGVDSLSPSLYPFGPTNNSGNYTSGVYINDGGTFTLPNGQYKATLYGKDTGNPALPNLNDVKAKSKVFKVICDITAAAPTQSNPCGTTNDTYTIPTTAGVSYEVKIGNGSWTSKTAGTYNYNGASTITIRAVSTDNDVNVAEPNQWTFTYSNVTCLTTVTAQAATNHDEICGSNNDTYTIPNVTGVQYKVNGVDKNAGTYSTNGATSLTITAVAKSGYVLTGTTSWTLTFVNKSCVSPAAPTSVDMCGTSDDTYTIPSTTGVIYKVNGVTKSAGQYQTNADVTVTAEPANSNYALTGTTSWLLDLSQSNCPAPTADVTFSDVCGTSNDSYTIPASAHVTYKIYVSPSVYSTVAAGSHWATGTVTIKAFADNGYELTGTTEWSQTFDSSNCQVAADAPTFTEICGDGDTFTVPVAPAHVTYKQLTGYIMFVIPVYTTVSAGVHSASGTVTIIAVADEGYAVTGASSWSQTFDSEKCQQQLTAEGDPFFNDMCGTDNDNYTIVAANNVTYRVNGIVTPAGFFDQASGDITITAEPTDPNYVLVGETSWTHQFSSATCADITATAECDRTGVIVTLTNDGDSEGTVWVNGDEIIVPGNDSISVTVPFVLWKASVEVYASDETALLVDDFDCTPGRGGIGGEQPQTPSVPAKGLELPQTGGTTNGLQQLLTVIASGIIAYGATFFLVNRRDLSKK